MQNIISFQHDDMTFYYTKQSISNNNNNNPVGFYFDHNNMPQHIMKNSLYSNYIYKHFHKQ